MRFQSTTSVKEKCFYTSDIDGNGMQNWTVLHKKRGNVKKHFTGGVR